MRCVPGILPWYPYGAPRSSCSVCDSQADLANPKDKSLAKLGNRTVCAGFLFRGSKGRQASLRPFVLEQTAESFLRV